ncbi:unnamed protein product, partial [Rotaria socialis]
MHKNTIQTSITLKPLEEQILSQKLSQLSITTTNEIIEIPDYLSKENQSFKCMLTDSMSTTAMVKLNHVVEELRQIAILIHSMKVNRIYHPLWTIYLKSGMGQLFLQSKEQSNYSTHLQIWPTEIKKMIQNSTNANDIYMNYVNNHLLTLDVQFRQYEVELDKKTKNFHGYSLQLQRLVETYIERNISSLRMEIKHKIELVHYDYHIQAIKLAYYRHHPSEYQKRLMQQLCSAKFEQELTEQEFHLVQQQISHYNSSCQSFESSTICKSILLDSIQDSNIRQQLLDQYQDIAQQSKMSMLTLFKESAKIQMDESKNKFEMAMKQTWHDRHLSSDNDKIPLAMINLIEQRYKKISERIQCVYKFKAETILFMSISLLDKIYVLVSIMNVDDTNDLDDHRLPRQRRRKQCHGNRRDQRFRRKYRKRNMQEKTIKKLLDRRHQAATTTNNNNNNMEIVNSNQRSTTINDTSTSTMINDNKRKRNVLSQEQKLNQIMIKSTSQLLIDPPLSKKMKEKDSNRVNETYRQPMYLKRLPLTFFPILSKKLNYTLKKKNERRIFYARLDLLDQQYCLEVDQHLWQSYLDIGLRKQIWPDQLYTMANTNNFNVCQEYLINYINDIKQQLHQCQMELTKLYQSRPIATLSMNEVDRCLKEFIVCQRKYLSIRNNNQLVNFQDDLSEKELFTLVSAYSLTTNQNEHMHQLITIREQQVKIWEQLLMLRMRILDKFLPQHFDDLEHFIAPNIYSPVISNTIAIQFKNKHYKIIQEAKRSWLNITLHAYEIKIQEYDRQYQYELVQLKSRLLNSMTLNGESMFHHLNEYANSRTKKLKAYIHHRFIIHCLIFLGPSCIRLNQSAIRPRHQQEIQIKKEYSDINQKVVQYLTSPPRNIPSRAMILKTYS